MTTITIERAFLIKVLDHLDIAQSLLERSQHHAKIAAMYKELRAALAAPATAPERKPITVDEIVSLAYDCNALPEVVSLIRLCRALEAFHGITGEKP